MTSCINELNSLCTGGPILTGLVTEENGVFDPLPAQAVFDHITKACVPPPRLIVVSFVNSVVTQ